MKRFKEFRKFCLYFIGFVFGPALIYELLSLLGIKGSDMLMSVICSFIYSLVIYAILRKKLFEDGKKLKGKFSYNVGNILKWWGIGIGIMMLSNFIINFFIFNGSIAANEESVRGSISAVPLLSAISIMFLAPFTEEITFRYSLRGVFKSPWFYAICSGFIFGFLHAITGIDFNNLNVMELLEFLYIIPYGALGFAFAMLYYKTDNIWLSIFAHAFHNTFTFLLIVLVS